MEKVNTSIAGWLTSQQAAQYLGLADTTLRKSRSTGVLCGRTPPPYRKYGRVQYAIADLDAWIEGFKPQTSTHHKGA